MLKDLGSFKDRNPGGISKKAIAREIQRVFPGDSLAHMEAIVDQFFMVLATSLEYGKRIEIRGFGSLFAKRVRQRKVYVPSAGKLRVADAKWKVVFKTSKDLQSNLMASLEE